MSQHLWFMCQAPFNIATVDEHGRPYPDWEDEVEHLNKERAPPRPRPLSSASYSMHAILIYNMPVTPVT